MKNLCKISLLLFAAATMSACSQPDKKPATDESAEMAGHSPDNVKTGSDETNSINKLAEGGMMEVLMGNLAAENAADPRVKAYGKMLAKDHSAADDKLQALATEKNVTLPDKLPAEKEQHINMMKEQKGADFDAHYISMMVEDHKKDIAEYKELTKKLNDPKLVDFANEALPVLQKHLDSAEAIQKSMKK
ncbi:MAG: DUF4142 domain-containing protein [Mucilaginibacter polytrichastri]|nr:DUF4142 domain-containing protein [Mucilaginibacter polytrichastri]